MTRLFTPEYINANRELHARDRSYGTGGWKLGALLPELTERHGLIDCLDYGCGKQTLRDPCWQAGLSYKGYDPAIPGMEKAEPADLVVCGDVMEHVEPGCVDAVLDHIRELAKRAALFAISCEPGTRRLPNGELAHCSVHPPAWWLEKLRARWAAVVVLDPVDSGQLELVALAMP